MSTRADLMFYFRRDIWDRNVVLIDEFSCLNQAKDDVRDDCLVALRGLKGSRDIHTVKCFIAAGTFSVVHMNPSTSALPPFNVANEIVQCPPFIIDETRKLFLEFAKDLGFSIDDVIVEDV